MVQAVAHILVPIILMSLFKDWYDSKHKKKFPLHYVLIAGLAGVLPDIDILVLIFTDLLGYQALNTYFAITHSILFPMFFLVLFLALRPINIKARICNISQHKLKLSTIFLMIFIGITVHIFLDFIFGSEVLLLYPFSILDFGINVLKSVPYSWGFIMSILDGLLFVLWIAYMGIKHKISGFI